MKLLFYSVALFGFAYIVGHSSITMPFRKLLAPEDDDPRGFWWAARTLFVVLLECPACLSWWVGLFVAAFGQRFGLDFRELLTTRANLMSGPNEIGYVVLMGLYSSGAAYVIAHLAGVV